MNHCLAPFPWILMVTLPVYLLVGGESSVSGLSQILDTVKNQNNGRGLDPSANCSSETRCWCGEANGIEVADCSALNLTAIPNFRSTVDIVDLRYNQIVVVNNTDQLPQHLLYLDLSNNRLTNFTGSPFDYLTKLLYLDLSDNCLSYLPSIYPQALFSNLTSLISLNIKGNNERSESAPLHYPSAVSTILSLATLKMDGLKNARLGDVLSPLKTLTTLDLSGRDGHCWIGHLSEDFFEGVSGLVDIDLSMCKIVYIDKGTFRPLSNLMILSLSGNNQLTFNVLRNLTYDLQFTNILKLFLNNLHCKYGVGTFLFYEDLMLLNNTHLQELYLDTNRIELVEDTMLQYLPESLKLLSVAGNKFTLGKYLIAMRFLKSLKYLDISLQFSQKGTINEMLEQCFDWRCPKERQDGSTEPRSLDSVDELQLSYLFMPPNLEDIVGHSSSFRGMIGNFNFMERNVIKQVDLHNNLLQSWVGPVRNLHQVEYVDLSYNTCGHVTTHFFEDFPNMTTLNVSHNHLGEVFKNDTTSDIFKQLKSLETLNMTHNRIDCLPVGVFRGIRTLQQIDLSFNQLTDFDVEIDHMHQLQLLNISHNRLIVLPKSFMSAVDRMTKYKLPNLTLDLRGNPLRCDCNKLDFLKWVERRKGLFSNIDTYDCRMTDETQISFGDLENIITKLEKDCSDYVGIIVGTLVVIVICVSLVIGGVVYRFRWKLRYLYYMAKNRYRGYSVVGDRSGSQYIYDAFISYSDSNSSFVIHDIVENLETNHGLRLCLHQRDFLPGNEIAVNITNAITNSRKTVAIITNSYLDSYWCMFEFNMARMESVYTRAEENVLFLILHEKLSRRQIPMDVLEVIESDSYIEYPDDEQGNVVFWDKIREAITG